jgi:ubiquinone/menaquinone biosynthesis C-methylase UbiE
MNVRLAKKNPVAGVRTFTVTSESEPDTKYVVVEVKRDGTQYFCQCSDWFYRRLPFIGTNLYSPCKHISVLLEALRK